MAAVFAGLSPRVRGNRSSSLHGSQEQGSIPARAGEPTFTSGTMTAGRVYPRACGGTKVCTSQPGVTAGLSPRVRGNPHWSRETPWLLGSIPARAGEPSGWCPRRAGCRVYPRACGGTTNPSNGSILMMGLSPRVRGNRCGQTGDRGNLRSIPARAGEPPFRVPLSVRCGVYPRACGGTGSTTNRAVPCWGLSPRVRGNLRMAAAASAPSGSIPARAGEPRRFSLAVLLVWVYPRACGGTSNSAGWFPTERGLSPRVRGNPHIARLPFPAKGLSPRVRGNRTQGRQLADAWGSIPARAGEPSCPTDPRRLRRVYPRACGGTTGLNTGQSIIKGLSPRVRGNPAVDVQDDRLEGSIPARAGEPKVSHQGREHAGVYPRACGGTDARGVIVLGPQGLSPRVRGNLHPGCSDCHEHGSIPARAGEPPVRAALIRGRRVYPRACGGTLDGLYGFGEVMGLSPRVRGNQCDPDDGAGG